MAKAIWKALASPGLWVLVLPVAIGYAPTIQARVSPDSFAHVFIASLVPMLAWTLGKLRLMAEAERTAQESHKADTARSMVQARQLEVRALEMREDATYVATAGTTSYVPPYSTTGPEPL